MELVWRDVKGKEIIPVKANWNQSREEFELELTEPALWPK
jgi:hypothetical protein